MTASPPALVILHGAAGSHEEVAPWRAALAAHFRVHALDLCGHGSRALPSTLSMPAFRADLLAQLDTLGLAAPLLLGYSFGGVVALDFAAHHPARVSAVVTLATRWRYDAANVSHAVHLLQEDRLLRQPDRVASLERQHPRHDWRLLAARLRAMYQAFAVDAPLSDSTLAQVQCPSLHITGTADPILPVPHLLALHQRVPGSTPATFAGSAHPPAAVPVPLLVQALVQWTGRLALA